METTEVDPVVKKIRVRSSGVRNYLWGLITLHSKGIIHRIIVTDCHGENHVVTERVRWINKVWSLSDSRHFYHLRYSVKVPGPVNRLVLERFDLHNDTWEPVCGVSFEHDILRKQFKPGRYMLFDTFEWDDIVEH